MSTYADYSQVRNLFSQGNFRNCYEALNNIFDRNAEWYFMRGVSAMNLGYYEEGEDFIKRAKFMDPENQEYSEAYNRYINYRNGYNDRANYYNNNRQRMNNPGCCCCCGDSCCDTLCTLWCCDSCCECAGGDLITCC
ncbi:hypothetical protein [Peptostreptococcus porci]|uniref:tetratricopeptide repeat protein n=1 Tax=Peptostreptococcus porci TaxID=2652282 RepID=UPI002A7F8BA7|nr:hypothetical protein [Peptostreptococcus porci]MDY4128932.1 hypothetical protein [Peptostreptococcus porci]